MVYYYSKLINRWDTNNDSELEYRLNEWTKEGLELVTLYPRGSGAVFVVFRKKTKE